MPKTSADFAKQSDPECNEHFSRRWIEPAWLTGLGTSRLGTQRIRPIDAMVRHSADSALHVLAGRMLGGQR